MQTIPIRNYRVGRRSGYDIISVIVDPRAGLAAIMVTDKREIKRISPDQHSAAGIGASLVRQLPMWQCPRCRRRFANRNQSHFCGRYPLSLHLRGKPAGIRKLYQLFVRHARRLGPVTIVPEKTRIALHVRMSFAALQLRQTKLVGHLVLAERHELPCFVRIDSISPHNHVHHFRIASPQDLSRELSDCIRKAYSVGRQEHLQRP